MVQSAQAAHIALTQWHSHQATQYVQLTNFGNALNQTIRSAVLRLISPPFALNISRLFMSAFFASIYSDVRLFFIFVKIVFSVWLHTFSVLFLLLLCMLCIQNHKILCAMKESQLRMLRQNIVRLYATFWFNILFVATAAAAARPAEILFADIIWSRIIFDLQQFQFVQLFYSFCCCSVRFAMYGVGVCTKSGDHSGGCVFGGWSASVRGKVFHFLAFQFCGWNGGADVVCLARTKRMSTHNPDSRRISSRELLNIVTFIAFQSFIYLLHCCHLVLLWVMQMAMPMRHSESLIFIKSIMRFFFRVRRRGITLSAAGR